MSLRTFLTSVVLLISQLTYVHAQQKSNLAADTGLVLEMSLLKSEPPGYQTIYWPDSASPGDWMTRFDKVADWQLPSGALPVRAVRVRPVLTGHTVAVQVSVLRGLKNLNAEDEVGTYTLGENEKATVDAAKDFGVEPFEIRVRRISSLPSKPPGVENPFSSLEVVSIERAVSVLPFYKFSFRNISEKSIDALILQVRQGEEESISGMPQGSEGKPLMLPGETSELRLPFAYRVDGNADNYLPSEIEGQRLVIRAVLFSDGSAEGFPPRNFLLDATPSRKIELRCVISILESLHASADSDLINGAAKLRTQIQALNSELTSEKRAELNQASQATQSSQCVEGGSQIIRAKVLDSLRRLPSTVDVSVFRAWLAREKERYSNWLSRLETLAASQN